MNKFDKEHVTQYFYKNSEIFLIKNFVNKRKNKLIKTAVDSKRDLVNILRNVRKLKKKHNKLKQECFSLWGN